MISKIFATNELQMKAGWPKLPIGQPVVADWDLIGSRCAICGMEYNHTLLLKEVRPVLEGLDESLPTLYICPGGDLSERGAFGWREGGDRTANLLRLNAEVHPHWFRKSRQDLLFLIAPEQDREPVLLIQTRRYTNTELWPELKYWAPEGGRGAWSGLLGYVEEDRSTVVLLDRAEFLPLPKRSIRETTHMRCRTLTVNIGHGITLTVDRPLEPGLCVHFSADENPHLDAAPGAVVRLQPVETWKTADGDWPDLPWTDRKTGLQESLLRDLNGREASENWRRVHDAGLDIGVETEEDCETPTGRICVWIRPADGSDDAD